MNVQLVQMMQQNGSDASFHTEKYRSLAQTSAWGSRALQNARPVDYVAHKMAI